jgi:cell division protein FtsW
MVPRGNSSTTDRTFLIFIGILAVFGLASLFSATTPMGYAKFNDAYFFVKRQMLFGLLPGIIALIIAIKIPLPILKKLSWPIYIFSLLLLVSVFIPQVSLVVNGSRSWIHLGNLSFQPAEFAKIGIIFILAYLLAARKQNWDNWQTSLLPILAILSPAFLLVLLQPDVGSLSIMVVVIFTMLYSAHLPLRYLAILGLAGVACFCLLIAVAPYRADRLTTFLHPELDPKGQGYQMNQSFLAVGSGGIWGLGFGHSRQKFQYLPEVDADSIFAVIAEENGFFISTGLVLFIVFITWRGLKIAKHSTDTFSALLVVGIMVWFVWQSFLNIGAAVGALPLTGVPLPLVSHGGSALLVVLTAMGLVVNVSKKKD